MKTKTLLISVLLLLSLSISAFPELNPGSPAPEIYAADWLNTDEQVSLADLKGKVIVLEFWATWCGPCIQAIPHIIEMYEEYSVKDVVFISLTAEDRYKADIDNFIDKMNMEYIIGTGSSSSSDYGVRGIPHAIIIDTDGLIKWQGHPMSNMEYALTEIMGINSFTKTAIENYRVNNSMVVKTGSVKNDTNTEITISLHHPDSPQNGVHTSYKILPNQELTFWDGKYGIGNDWGISYGTDEDYSLILFLGDTAIVEGNKYKIYVTDIISKTAEIKR